MKHRGSEITIILLVLAVAVVFRLLSSKYFNNRAMGADWTLTRVDILSLRLAAPKPSLQIRLRVKSLGCQRCYRGCRAGRLVGRLKQKMKMKLTHSEIPIIIGRCSKQGRRHEPHESVLRHIDTQAAAVVTVSQPTSTRNVVPRSHQHSMYSMLLLLLSHKLLTIWLQTCVGTMLTSAS